MNIQMLKYMVSIVENGYNITQAASELFISQPALSKALSQLEKEISFQIFERHKGRLSHLTQDGQLIYEHAKKILKEYDELMHLIELRTQNEQGEVLLGIPPLVISTLFADFLNQIKEKNAKVHVNIAEHGGHQLEEMFKEEKVNFAILLDSPLMQQEDFRSLPIHLNEYAIFLNKNHPLAKKKKLRWEDLNGVEISVVDETYSTYHILQSYLKQHDVTIAALHTGFSWDYLLAALSTKNNVVFMPKVTESLYNMRDIRAIPFKEPVPWDIYFVWRKKSSYTSAESYLIESFQSYFKK